MTEQVVVGVGGEADRLLIDGLEDLRPLFATLGHGVLVIGGLMTRIWLHRRPIDVPPRATADLDLGVDRQALRLTGDRRIVEPLLRKLGFQPRPGEEQFRFVKDLGGRSFPVDLGVAPGSSRAEPPLLELGMTTIAIPGLAYALGRRVTIAVEFVDGDRRSSFELPLPALDAAFVLKGALVESGVRMRPDRRRRDTVDAVSLAAACAGESEVMASLHAHRQRSDVRAAIGWLSDSFSSSRTAAARRVQAHFAEEAGISTGAEWAAATAEHFMSALGK